MAEFKPITTQEEFDVAIKDRLEQAGNAVRQQFSDYDTTKKDYEALKTDAVQKDATITDLQNQLKGARAELAKTRIALEKGLPAELSARLTGETEDEIRKDAETLASLLAKQRGTAPMRDQEPGSGGTEKAALKKMLNNLKGDN